MLSDSLSFLQSLWMTTVVVGLGRGEGFLLSSVPQLSLREWGPLSRGSPSWSTLVDQLRIPSW